STRISNAVSSARRSSATSSSSPGAASRARRKRVSSGSRARPTSCGKATSFTSASTCDRRVIARTGGSRRRGRGARRYENHTQDHVSIEEKPGLERRQGIQQQADRDRRHLDPGEPREPLRGGGQLLGGYDRRRRTVEHEVLDLEQIENELAALVQGIRLELLQPSAGSLGLAASPRDPKPRKRAEKATLRQAVVAENPEQLAVGGRQ